MFSSYKALALVLVCFFTISCLILLTAKCASAQSISAPNFTVKVIDGSYTAPASYSTDPYTGQTITHEGATYQTRNFTFTIQNVPQVNYYLLEYKGHYASQWSPVYAWGLNVTTSSSAGSQTIITIFSSNPAQYSVTDPLYLGSWAYDFASGSKLDFRLQAVSGSESNDPAWGYSALHPRVFGNTSPWSNIQTIQIGEPLGSPSPTATVPEFSWLAILSLFAATLPVAIAIRHRKIAKAR